MAELTKTQIKKRLSTLLDKLVSIRDELEELKDDVENESSNIVPYEGKDELTGAQEVRQEWLDGIVDEINYITEVIDASELPDYMEK